MKYALSLSGGLGSFMAGVRLIENGIAREDIDFIFCDTLIEDEDLYRFVDDTARYLQVEITRLKDGRHPWEVFKDVKYQGNTRTAHCSDLLKTEMFKNYIEQKYNWNCTVVLGMDYQEEDRISRSQKKYPCPVIAPMGDKPWLSRKQVVDFIESRGLKIPRLYSFGFVHNNCGGFCVRAGLKQFRLLFKTFPDRYKWHEEQQEKFIAWYEDYKTQQFKNGEISEEEWREDMASKGHPFLRKTIGGVQQYITLKEFREKFMEDKTPDQFDNGVGCGCFTGESLS